MTLESLERIRNLRTGRLGSEVKVLEINASCPRDIQRPDFLGQPRKRGYGSVVGESYCSFTNTGLE